MDPKIKQHNYFYPAQNGDRSISTEIKFRQVIPAEIPACYEIERLSYPKDEAASKSVLQYRQHFAEKYFRCAVLVSEHDNEDNHDVEQIIGFICATRCYDFTERSMSTHDSTGPILAIHSVVVDEKYRRRGIATAMLRNYIENMYSMASDGVERFVLLAKVYLLPFYLKAGFSVLKLSNIVHGQELWYHLELQKEVSALSWVVDSFTTTPGKGNPAAVVLIEKNESLKENDEEQNKWCKTVAREFNLSETAVVWKIDSRHLKKNAVNEMSYSDDPPKGQQEKDAYAETFVNYEEKRKTKSSIKSTSAVSVTDKAYYGIRYFTCNGTEVDLCGHASLAAAAVLFQQNQARELIFSAKHDELTITPCKYWNGKRMQLCMQFPKKHLKEATGTEKETVSRMIQKAFPKLKDFGKSNIIYVGVDEDGGDLFVEVNSPKIIESIGYENIAYSAFLDWEGYNRGVIICSASSSKPAQNKKETEPDVVSRFFGPKVGINEDPVTGSAHCVIAPYFAEKLNKKTIVADQLSKRGGRVLCTVEDSNVLLKGSAVITLSGNLWI